MPNVLYEPPQGTYDTTFISDENYEDLDNIDYEYFLVYKGKLLNMSDENFIFKKQNEQTKLIPIQSTNFNPIQTWIYFQLLLILVLFLIIFIARYERRQIQIQSKKMSKKLDI